MSAKGSTMRWLLAFIVISLAVARPRPAAGDDASTSGDDASTSGDDGGSPACASLGGSCMSGADCCSGVCTNQVCTAPLACDGALCNTTNGSTFDCACNLARRPARGAPVGAIALIAIAALALGAARMRRLLVLLLMLGATTARAAPAPVDVVIHEPPPPHRIVLLELNPLPLIFIGKISANVIVTPKDHHALVLCPFYVWGTNTAPIYVVDDSGTATQLPRQNFVSAGAELGYRYYFGKGGPRGFFLGPSLILGWVSAGAANGTTTNYLDYGFAADGGYQVLIANRVAISLGAGVQLTDTTTAVPKQQFPARIYANGGVLPRLLLSIGWAF